MVSLAAATIGLRLCACGGADDPQLGAGGASSSPPTAPDTAPAHDHHWAEQALSTHPLVHALHSTRTGADVELTDGDHPHALGAVTALAHASSITLRAASYNQPTLADIVRTIAEHTELETSR